MPRKKIGNARTHYPALKELQEVREQNVTLEQTIDQLQENLADVVLALDNVGWKPFGSDVDATEIPLDTIKETAQTTRALVAINPLVKRGVAVRTSYIWANGVEFQGIDDSDPLLASAHNRKFVFSSEAQAELEKCLATDGNLFVLMSKPKGRRSDGALKLSRVPMSQIVGTVTDPENREDVWFYRRKWEIVKNNNLTDNEQRIEREEYFPAADYDVELNGKPVTIRGKKVNWDSAILHHAPNKQVGWKWGAPDTMSIIFWAKAHKEFLENSATLVKSYARFAFKVTAPTKAGVTAAATKVAAQPTRDPVTGETLGVGGTAVMGMGTNMTTLGRTAGSVDFNAGLPLAAYIAAGLEIPLTDLTSDAGSANRSSAETLNTSTIKAMEGRQQSWSSFFGKIFEYAGKANVKTVWKKIDQEPVHRAMQAIAVAVGLNVLHATEVRDLIKNVWGIENDNDLPTEGELGLMILGQKKADEQAAQAPDQAGGTFDFQNPSNSDNSLRDIEGQHDYSSGSNG